MAFWRDITTTKDGDSFDISRVIIVVNAVVLVPVLVLGIGFYLYGYINAKPFNVQEFFTAVLTYEGGVGALLTTGAASIAMKKSTEPNGSSVEEETITKGRQPDVNVNTTVIKT